MAASSTKQVFESGSFVGIINILMQLRKVCNHPSLFEPRLIDSPFEVDRIMYVYPLMYVCLLLADITPAQM